MVAHAARTMVTYDDFACIPPDGKRWELIAGDLEVNAAPNSMHQVYSRRLQYALMTQLEKRGLAEVYDAPFDVILDPHNVVEPDLVIVAAANKGRVSDRGLEGAPDVVVEILSQNRAYDEVVKRRVYEAFGIPEYWIVDGAASTVTVLVLDGGRYVTRAVFGATDTLTSVRFDAVHVELAEVFAPR